MKVYVLIGSVAGYESGDEPLGVYSTLELARAAERGQHRDEAWGIFEVDVDAPAELDRPCVPDPEPTHWWDRLSSMPKVDA